MFWFKTGLQVLGSQLLATVLATILS